MVEKFIMAGDTALHICDSEHGERVVVLLHGYLESILVWDSFVPLIYKSVRVITLDLPGHGISEVQGEVHTMEWLATVVRDMLTQLGIDKCTLVGHSMGGYIAAAFTANYPERVNSLIMLSSTPNADSELKKENRLREIKLIESGKRELLARTTPQNGFAKENLRRLNSTIEEMQDIILLTEDEGIIALLRGMMCREDLNEALQQSSVPQLFIFGEKDGYIPLELSQKIAAAHPQAKTVWFKESGHNSFLEESEAVAATILEFIK